MSSNSSEKVKVKEEIKYELIDNFNESNVEEFEESKTFAQPLNSTINGSINESQPSIDVSNIGLNNEMIANLQNSGNDMYFSLRQSSKLMTEIESVFKCLFPKCGKKFANSNGLRRHRLTHPEKKLKKIRKRSSKPMSTRSGLEFKLLTSTPIIPRRRRRINISKAEEAKESQTQTSLSIGLSANKSVIKKLICEYPGCQKSFDKTDRFKRHFLTHSDIRPFDCPHEGCGKVFKERSTLLMHERIHSGEKPYACDYENCGKRFTQLAQIQAHKRIHTNHKPFVCNFDNCGQRFKQMSHLLCHERSIHTNEKPFLCTLDGCNKRFAQMASLLSHSKIH
jgi:KRAB domain-containing zinc finger protein